LTSTPVATAGAIKRDALNRRILDAALELFAEAGYNGTSIPDVMDRAGVGAGSLYRLFESKEALINAVFRDAKGRLERALKDGLAADLSPRALFDAFWERLTAFARAEPLAFRFLELQDHVRYLDGESRQLEIAVLAPILLACMDFQRRKVFRDDVPADAIMAFVWGAFVGLVKAERLGYVKLDPAAFSAARDACWRAFALEAEGAANARQPKKDGRRRWKRR
jgi:AcrR family transcriptional regulator